MSGITLYGFPVSPNVRAARIALLEKGVPFAFEPIGMDHLATEAYGLINPFRKMPALTHGEVALYETPALMVYAEALGFGASLAPSDALAHARMWQFIGIAQTQLYPIGAMQLYFHAVLARVFGMESDPAAAQAALPVVAGQLDVLEAALGEGYLTGRDLSLADLYCGAVVDYIYRTRHGRALIAARPNLQEWITALRSRPSFVSTFAPMLEGTDEI
jgi:glutathione S-transferase